jgi:hypothetical protein
MEFTVEKSGDRFTLTRTVDAQRRSAKRASLSLKPKRFRNLEFARSRQLSAPYNALTELEWQAPTFRYLLK